MVYAINICILKQAVWNWKNEEERKREKRKKEEEKGREKEKKRKKKKKETDFIWKARPTYGTRRRAKREKFLGFFWLAVFELKTIGVFDVLIISRN